MKKNEMPPLMLTLMVRKDKIFKNKDLLYDTPDFVCRTTSMSTLDKATWTTLVHAGGLDKLVTLKLVGAATIDIEQLLSPTSWTQSMGAYVLSWVHKIDVVLECARQP